MKKIILPITLLALCASFAAAQTPKPATTAKQNQARPQDDGRAAVGGVLVSPLIQRLSSQPGRKAEVNFVLENPGKGVETALAEIVSFTTEDWTYRTTYGVEHAHDCAPWFAQKTSNLTIASGVRQEFRLQVNIPRGTDGAYWCMMRFTPKPNGSTTKSLVVYEIPIVFIIGKNPKPIVKVGTPFLRRTNANARSSSMMAVLPLDNASDGFTVLGAQGTLRNRDTNRVVADLQVEDRNLMPNTKRELNFVVPVVPDGKYKLEFKTILGSRSLPAVSSEIDVVKGAPKLASEASTLETTAISAEPTSLNLTIPAGGSRSTTVKVTNNSKKEMSFEVVPVPVDQGTNGAVGIGEGELPLGLSVDVSGEMSHIQPGQSATARVKISVPRTANGDLWFALAIREANNTKSLADALFGTITVPKTEKANLTVVDPIEVKDRNKTIAIKYKTTNTGNVALRPEANATVLADGVRLVDRLAVPEMGDGGILPGKTIINSVMLPAGLKPGSYVVEIAYQYSETDFARLRVPVTVVAPPVAKPAAKPTAKTAPAGKK